LRDPTRTRDRRIPSLDGSRSGALPPRTLKRRVSRESRRVRERAQSGRAKVVAFHKGHIHHGLAARPLSPSLSPPGETLKSTAPPRNLRPAFSSRPPPFSAGGRVDTPVTRAAVPASVSVISLYRVIRTHLSPPPPRVGASGKFIIKRRLISVASESRVMAPRSIIARGSTACSLVFIRSFRSPSPVIYPRPPSGPMINLISARETPSEKREIAPLRVTRRSSRVNRRLENAIIAYVPLPTVALPLVFVRASNRYRIAVQINLLLMISSLDDRRPTNASIRNDKERSRVGRVGSEKRSRTRSSSSRRYFSFYT